MPKVSHTKAKEKAKAAYVDELSLAAEKVLEKEARPSTDELFDKATKMSVDPFEILLHIADGNRMALDLDDSSDDKPISPELRAMAARECMKFLYPTMKSSEISGKDGAALPALAVRVLFGVDDKTVD